MVWDQGPMCIAGGLCLGKEYRQSLYQVVAVVIVPEDLSSFDPTNHHVVQDTGCIEAGLPRHGREGSRAAAGCQLKYLRTSPLPLHI